MLSVECAITGRDYDFEELRPLGEASNTPDHRLDDHDEADHRRQRSASVEMGYPEHPDASEAACRSCGAPILASQVKCRFCLTTHLDDTAADTANTQGTALVGIVFMLVESRTCYSAGAKGAAAASLLVDSEAEEAVDESRLIYDLDEEPAPQLSDRWPALPDTTRVTSATGEQLLTTIRQRTGWEDASTSTGEHEARTYLYDESGSAISNESRVETILESAEDAIWLVPAIVLRDASGEQGQGDQLTGSPTQEQLDCHHCSSETDHRFRTNESLPNETWSGQLIWECQACGTCRYGPEPQ